jgi:hypothetical protein
MDKTQIKRIAKTQGCATYFRRYELHSHCAQGVTRCYVFAVRNGVTRSVGNFEKVAQMSEDALRTLIESKFAPPVTATISGAQFLNILMGKEG